MGMKLELIVEVAVPRVVVSIIVIMYMNLVFISISGVKMFYLLRI